MNDDPAAVLPGTSYTDMLQDFLRLRDLATHPACVQFLNDMVNGLHREFTHPDEEADPRLVPVGPADDQSISVIRAGDAPASIWQCDSFGSRLRFLLTGRLAVIYPSDEHIVPLCLRTDVDALADLARSVAEGALSTID